MSNGFELQEYDGNGNGHGGEVARVEVIPPGVLESLTRAEIDIQIATARRFPRSINRFLQEAESLACRNADVAASCIYALPRGGKRIEGPSVRLAEIVAYSFGNLRVIARISEENDRFIVAQASAHDLEKNNGVGIEVRRSIRTKSGKMQDDMINVTANAALAIAYRNAVWKVVPAAFINQIYEKCKRVAAGEGKTIDERRKNVLDWIKSINVKPEELFAVLRVKGIEDIGLEQMAFLAGIMTSIKDGDISIDDVFRPKTEPAPQPAITADPTPSAPFEGTQAASTSEKLTERLKGRATPQADSAGHAPGSPDDVAARYRARMSENPTEPKSRATPGPTSTKAAQEMFGKTREPGDD